MITGIKDITSFKWATVTGTNPLAIQLDGDTAPLALIPDSLIDPFSLAVGSRVRVELSLRKVVVHGTANGDTEAGRVEVTAAAVAPPGWLLCQGQSLLRSQYPRLFAAIGTTYGMADATHFNVPETRGRTVVGRDAGQVEFDALGESGGAKTHTLTIAQMPSHTHGPSSAQFVMTGGANDWVGGASGFGVSSGTAANGGNGAHNNLQPYLVLNYIIKI